MAKYGRKDPQRFLQHRKRYMDIIVQSSEIKKVLKERADKVGVSFYDLCRAAGVSYITFKAQYLDKSEPLCSPELRQEHVMEIGKLLGVKIRVMVALGDIDIVDINRIRNHREQWYVRTRRGFEDKGFNERHSGWEDVSSDPY